eukprot:TRINITY_DN58942_c0_g1_i1.p1 TRINITY_DN58942_c0_g1~~TRINITY_DN58942_c0_g1_i1.p1  ORF type:complete len:312 (-),score=31.92 TRINITY_DN58942_c0_g1_i1:9-944(-)
MTTSSYPSWASLVPILSDVFGPILNAEDWSVDDPSSDHHIILSDHVWAQYGTIRPQGIAAVIQHLQRVLPGGITSADSFCDIGSGIGNVVVQAALMGPFGDSLGIEVMSSRHLQALSALRRLDRIVPAWHTRSNAHILSNPSCADAPPNTAQTHAAPSTRQIRFLEANAATDEAWPAACASVLFCNAWCFQPPTLAAMAEHAASCGRDPRHEALAAPGAQDVVDTMPPAPRWLSRWWSVVAPSAMSPHASVPAVRAFVTPRRLDAPDVAPHLWVCPDSTRVEATVSFRDEDDPLTYWVCFPRNKARAADAS